MKYGLPEDYGKRIVKNLASKMLRDEEFMKELQPYVDQELIEEIKNYEKAR